VRCIKFITTIKFNSRNCICCFQMFFFCQFKKKNHLNLIISENLPPEKLKSYLGHGDSLSSHSLAAPSKSLLTDGLGIDFCDVQYSLWIYLVTTARENLTLEMCSILSKRLTSLVRYDGASRNILVAMATSSFLLACC